ncbi:tetratricopeptide repeat protein [Pelagicoccus sp. SDUM812003]|uniref:tetratricopeptide repeat protein n=1 Tax=Pelagicoccus sp. SDUM812003 TaxID=3041267 RepID=UPI0028104E6E|nr:tetratricopeptide repeat protein [Pelagicoccus sp. SDUM812003]MDQ8203936.1 tetratricopeptide repeat protein [Pelagicoccus sp. SDUM812003]
MYRRFFKQVAPLLVSLAIVGGLSLLVTQFSKQVGKPFERLVVETLPEIPPLHGWPDSFVERLDAAHSGLSETGDGQARALAELAFLYFANGFTREAESCLLGLEAYQPENGRWPYLIAALRDDYSDTRRQLRYLDRALALDPTIAYAHQRRGEALLQLGEWEAARQAFQSRLASSSGDAWAMVGLAGAALGEGRFELAEQWLLQALEAEPRATAPYELLGDLYLETGDIEAAKQIRDRFEASVASLSRGWDDQLEFVDSHCYEAQRLTSLAQRHARWGHLDQASTLFGKALRLYPGFPDALLGWAEMVWGEEGAVSEAAAAAREFPYADLVTVCVDEGRGELAEQALLHWRNRANGGMDAERQLARLHHLLENWEQAEAAYRRVLQAQEAGSDPSIASDYGLLLLRVRPEQGRDWMSELLESSPELLEARLALGYSLLDAGAYDRARTHLEAALALDPDYPGLAEDLRAIPAP